MIVLNSLATIAEILEEKTGVATSEQSLEILKQKIIQFMLVHNDYRTDEDLLQLVAGKSIHDRRMREHLVEYLLNHETSFFRDRLPFAAIKKYLLPALKAQGKKKIRIWSAACSKGQEPYSIALMLLKEAHLFRDLDIEIYASDISSIAIEKAQKAIFNKLEIQRGLPISDLIYYFEQINMNLWQLKEEVVEKVNFFQHNILEPLPHLYDYKFDIILCRNALIYFRQKTRKQALKMLHHNIAKDGYLIVGASESMINEKQYFLPCKNDYEYLIYQPV